jgi:hypothetical protein
VRRPVELLTGKKGRTAIPPPIDAELVDKRSLKNTPQPDLPYGVYEPGDLQEVETPLVLVSFTLL